MTNTGDPNSNPARDSRHFIFLALFFSVFVNLLMLTGPLFMLQVYDRVLGSRSEETLVALLVLVLSLYGLMWLLDFARARLLARFGARFQSSLDQPVFQAQFAEGGDAAAKQTASRDLEAVQGFFASPALTAIMDAPFTPIFIAVIFVFHPLLGWFALGGGIILVVITIINQILTSARVKEAQGAAETAHRFSENTRRAGDLIRSQGMLNAVTERWLDHRSEALQKNMTAVDWTGAFSTFTKSFRLSLQSMVLALGAWLVLKGELTAGAMIAGSILLGRALAPIEQIIGRWPQIARARQGWASLSTVLSETKPPPPRTSLPRPEGRLDLAGVTVTTAPGTPPILYNVTFSVASGEVLGVIGRSGSGKTTIARTILGLVAANVGEVRLGGALVGHYDPEELGAHIGYLPQDSMLISGTIAENIARMSRTPDSAKVVEAAKKAKAHELILTLPDAYETRIEDTRIGLSGGQRQRIALARALYGEPVLLVLDEPNSALDQEGSEALNSAIRTMKSEGRSVVIMTHRPVAISECDRLLVVDGGRVKAQGPRDEIIKSMMRNADDVRRVVEVSKDG